METLPSQMPFAPVYDADCRVLVLGSHPSVASKRQGFYYMHPQNRFWRVMGALFGEDFVSADAQGKRALLLGHHVALYDVVYACDIAGSSDASIRHVTPCDLRAILATCPIERIYLNGGTAYRLFCRFHPDLADVAQCLPSTSAANARCALGDLVTAWQGVKTHAEGGK